LGRLRADRRRALTTFRPALSEAWRAALLLHVIDRDLLRGQACGDHHRANASAPRSAESEHLCTRQGRDRAAAARDARQGRLWSRDLSSRNRAGRRRTPAALGGCWLAVLFGPAAMG